MRPFVAALLLLIVCVSGARGQAKYTAKRLGDLQAGVDYVYDKSDYDPTAYKGYGAYATFDFRSHLGAEIDFRQANSRSNDQAFQQTYEIGPRYFRNYGRFEPYAKVMYGRARFRFPQDAALLAYNMFAGGIGTDVHIKPYLNVRVDYEYQTWRNFPPRGLDPQVISVGVAYHFPGNLRRLQHYGK